ncbi:MAG: helix-turn-helix domain-containing protein, partial [Acidimicrobiales bacterium]
RKGDWGVMGDELERFIATESEADLVFVQGLADERAFLRLLKSLRARREAVGLTQREVARAMGTTQSAVSALEHAESDPRLSTLQRYVRAVAAQLVLSYVSTVNAPTVTADQRASVPQSYGTAAKVETRVAGVPYLEFALAA